MATQARESSDPFAQLWWLLGLRGLAGIALAVLAFVWPLFTLEALLFGFGVYAIADGGVALYAGARRHAQGYPFWPFAVEGALGILFGGVIIAFPDATAFVLWYLIAGWALVTGVFEIVAALRLRRVCEGELMLASAGCASLVLGALMLMWPRAAMITMAWLVGIYAGLFGALLLALAGRLRRLARAGGKRPPITLSLAADRR
jgi:uncharacterized membrane protein HdeD (DUF308 family)